MKCKECGEELIAKWICETWYEQDVYEYGCPNNCDFVKWLEEQEECN